MNTANASRCGRLRPWHRSEKERESNASHDATARGVTDAMAQAAQKRAQQRLRHGVDEPARWLCVGNGECSTRGRVCFRWSCGGRTRLRSNMGAATRCGRSLATAASGADSAQESWWGSEVDRR